MVRLVSNATPSPDICKETAKILAGGNVIGWFQGRSEFGPRALGNCSILADPRTAAMKDILNSRVKHRQPFRPFAPIVLKERADEIYDELKAGADFATLAKRYSLDTGSKEDGGKLTITRGQTVGPFDTTAFLLPAGSISRPVKTEFGYHVIQALSGVKPAQTTPFAQVQASISKQLLDDKKSKAVTTWLASVQKEYDGKVSYADGFAPPELQSTGSDAGTATNG